MIVRAIELKEANGFVAQHHRHHKPAVGHRFSMGAFVDDRLVGVVIVGRPVARMTCQRSVVEVTRLATDGTPNACSALYGAAARAARSLGYVRIQTFILETEPGTSLKASGWINDGVGGGGQWKHTGRIVKDTLFGDLCTNRTDQPTCAKVRWFRTLNKPARAAVEREAIKEDDKT